VFAAAQTRTSNDINFTRQFVKGKYTRETMTAAASPQYILLYIPDGTGAEYALNGAVCIYIEARRVPLPCAARGEVY